MNKETLFVDEKVFVRYIPNFKNQITDKTHPEYGGLSNNSKVAITAPLIDNRIKSIFSEEELDALSKALNIPDLSSQFSDFWKEYVVDKHGMSNSIFPIFLKKEGLILNKKNPVDYIYIKILEDCPIIGESIADAKNKDLQFALIKESDEFKKEIFDINSKKKAWKLYEKFEEDVAALRFLISSLGKAPATFAKKDFLQKEAYKLMETKQKMFLAILDDEFLVEKIAVTEFLKYKLINKSNNLYYTEKGVPIALDGDKNDITGCAKYFASGIGQEEYLLLKNKVDILNKKVPEKKE